MMEAEVEQDEFHENCEDCNGEESRELVTRQRSISLPAPSYGDIPSISEVQQSRGGWDKLGLYMMGLPPRAPADNQDK